MKLTLAGKHPVWVERLAALVLLVYPGAMLAVAGGMNGAFLLLLLLSISVFVFRPADMPRATWDRNALLYLVAMASLPVAVFISQTYHQDFSAHPYDAPSRLLLAVPIFMLLRRVKFNVVAVVQYGFPLGAIVGLVTGWYRFDESYGRMRTNFLDAIHFGDFELMLGMLSLMSINWVGRDVLAVRVLKIGGFLAGFYASYASNTRGGWVALPVFMVILYYFNSLKFSRKTSLAILLLLLTIVAGTYSFNQQIRSHMNGAFNDIQEYYRGNRDTDNGVRLQLYKAAIVIIARNPIFGVGAEGFRDEVNLMEKSGELTALAANVGRGEVHNDILSKTVAWGVSGLVAILLLFFAPLKIFAESVRSGPAQARQAGIMGITFVTGFFIFGMTVEVLNLTMATAFYSLTVAVLVGACLNTHHAVPSPASSTI